MAETQVVQAPQPPSPELIAARERALLFAAENIPAGPMRAMLVPAFREALLHQAGMLLDSYMVPDHFWPKRDLELQGEARDTHEAYRVGVAKANVVAALFIAAELGESAFAVMPQIYFIGGRPAWKTEFLRARLQKIHGISLRYTSTGSGDALAVTATATPPTGGEPAAVTVTMKEATADGWTKNSKYRSLPVRMLEERAASRWISLYAPMIKGGVPDALDVIDSEPPPVSVLAMPRPIPIPEPNRIAEAPTIEQPTAQPDQANTGELSPRDRLCSDIEDHEDAQGAPKDATARAQWRGEHGFAASWATATETQLRAYLGRIGGGAK